MILTQFLKRHYLKVASIIFAILLWGYVIMTAEVTFEKQIALSYQLPYKFSIANEAPKYIHVKMKGPRVLMRSVTIGYQNLDLDITEYIKGGKKKIQIVSTTLPLKFPFGVETLEINPSKIEIEVDAKEEKMVPIALEETSKATFNEDMHSYTISPKEIKVTGPRKLISTLTKVYTHAVPMSDLEGVGVLEIPLANPDTRLSFAFEKVKLRYDISKRQKSYTFAKIPIRYHSTKMVRKVNRRFAQIVVLAKQSLAESVVKKSVKAYIDIPDDASGTFEVELKVELSNQLELVELSPKTIKVTVEDK